MGTEGALSKARLLQIFQHAIAGMKKRSDQLRELDAACGDGDLGVTVMKGFAAVEEELPKMGQIPLNRVFKSVGMTFNNAAASTFGVFFATGCMSAGKSLGNKENVEASDLCTILQAAAEGVSKRGKAEVGDKTILDALVPAADAACQAVEGGASFYEALLQATMAAKMGVEKTKGMIPRVGRAHWLGEKTKDVQDPGATFVSMFLEELLEGYKATDTERRE